MQTYRVFHPALIAGAIAVLIGASSAHAGELRAPSVTKKVAVIEARVGSWRTPGDEISAAIVRAFEDEGYPATPAAVADALGARMPRPGVRDQRQSTASVLQPLSDGYRAWSRGRFEEAEALLVAGLETYKTNIALVVTDTSNQDIVFRAMAALALSQWARGESTNDSATLDAANQSMLDLQRYFPSRRFSSEEFSPDAIAFYRNVAKMAGALGTGAISIRVDNTNVMVFVDGKMRGTGRADLAGLIPGLHDVYLQEPGRGDAGRWFELRVTPNGDAIVEVEWEAHTAFWATPAFTGLAYASEAEREAKLPAHAAEVASWGAAGLVAAIERIDVAGHPAVRGILIANQSTFGTCTVDVTPDEPDLSARQLVECLMKSPSTREGQVAAGAPVDDEGSRRTSKVMSASILGAGLAAMVVGAAVELRTTPPSTGEQPKYLISYPGISLRVGGSVIAAAGLYFLLRSDDRPRQPSTLTKGLVLSGTLVMIGSTSLHVAAPLDEHHDARFRELSTGAFIVGAGSVGYGFYRWSRERWGTSRAAAAGLGAGVALTASAAFLLAVDEDDGGPSGP